MSPVKRAFEASNHIRPIQPGQRSIFRLDCSNDVIFYAPGYVALVGLPDADRFETMLTTPGDGVGPPALAALRDRLVQKAETALSARHRWQTGPFRPECLTLYLSNQCNLRCSYCYADAGPTASLKLGLNVIQAAARLVATSCREKNRPFTTVFHGGGEPTLDQAFARQVLTILDETAQNYELPAFRYIATNGVMAANKAKWLARRFDLVGLSCDGPADIQNRQRPAGGGGGTSHLVEQTAHILREQGCRFQVRVTITQNTLSRQAEIVDYLCQQLAPAAIHIEPAYLGGRASAPGRFEPEQAFEFVAHFLQARHKARQYDVPLLYVGSRVDTLHGPYCHVFRDVLNLVPGGVATACFKAVTAAQAGRNGLVIGTWQQEFGCFTVDDRAVGDLRRALSSISSACRGCFNRFHCVGECPDRCPRAESDFSQAGHRPGFRCRIQRALAMATLLERADRLRASANATTNRRESDGGYAKGASLI